jgi:hypothetical protein
MSCVNKNHPELKALSSQLGLTPSYTAAAVGVWQQVNNSDQFPSYGELKDFMEQDGIFQQSQKINNIKKKGLSQQIVLDLAEKMQNAIPGVRILFKRLDGRLAQRIGGTLYFDLEQVNSDTAMHEFGHIWLDIMEEVEPEQFAVIEKEVRSLLQQNPELNAAMKKLYPDIEGTKFNKEVAAHALGFRTESRVSAFVQSQNLNKSLTGRIMNFLNKIVGLFSSPIKKFFGTSVEIDLGDTLNTVFDKIADDLISGDKIFQNDFELNKDLMEYLDENNIDDERIGNMREFFLSLASNKGNRFEKGFYSDAKLAELILRGNSIQKNSKYPDKGAFVYQDRFIKVYLDTKEKSEVIRKVIPKYRLMEQEFKEGIANTLNEYLKAGNTRSITQIGTQNFGALKNDLRETAFEELLEELHLDGSVDRVMRYSDLRNSDEMWQRELYHQDMVGDDSIIFIHNSEGTQKTISVVNITMHPFHSGFNTKYLQRNIFRKFPGPKDSAVSKLGVTLRDTDGDIMLLGSLMTAKYAMMKDPNVRIKSVGVVGFSKKEVESHYSIEILNDFKNIDAIKEFKELYENIESTEMKKVIDFKNIKQSVTSEMDKLIQFYQNGGYTEGSKFQINENDIDILKGGSIADKQNVIKKRISILNDNVKADQREKSQEYRLLSMADYGLNTVSMADRNEIANISKVAAYFHTPAAVNSDVFQMVHKGIIKANGMIINETMKWHNLSKKLVEPIIKKRPGIALKSKAFDVGGQYFEHLYMTEKGFDENGNPIEIKLPGMLYVAKNIGTDENPRWEFLDAKTEQAYKQGLIDNDDLKYTWAVSNMVREKYAESIYEKNKYSYVGKDHHLFTMEDAYEKLDSSSFQFGMVPIMDKAMAEMVSSGMIKKAGVRWWEETTNVNALFTESLGELNRDNNNRLNDRFSAQMSFTHRLNMAGLEIDENGNYRISDRNLYNKLGYNLEKASVAFNLSTNRVNIYNDQVMHLYNSANVVLTMYQEMGKDQRFVKEALRNMVDRILFNEVRDTEEGGEVKMSKVVDTASRILTSAQILGRPFIGIKSMVWNGVQLFITGTANRIAANGHFTIGQAMKAMQYSWTHQELMIKMMREFNMIDRGEWDMLQNPTLIKSESAWWQQYYTSYVNYYADLQARGVAMFAEMMKEGSFGSYSLGENGKVVYDETKDGRLYKDGKITEEGRLLKLAIKKDLIEQGFMSQDDEKLTRGHDIVDANNFKYISDKWIVGSYDNISKSLASQHYVGRAAIKFRQFAASRLENLGVLTPNYKTEMGQKRVITRDEDGNVMYDADGVPLTHREMLEMEGMLQSYGKVFGYFANIKSQPNPVAYWKSLKPMTKNNIIRSVAELTVYASLFAIAVGFGGGDSEEEKKRRRHDKLLWGWMYSDVLTISLISDLYENPIPFLSASDRFLTSSLELITDGKVSKNLFSMIPGYGAVKDIDMVVDEYNYYSSNENQ